MGNICTTRDDNPGEISKQYETYTSLWQEVTSKLSDDAGFSAECSRVYCEECRKLGIEQLTKQQWQEMTIAFISRISCKDQRTRERIYTAIDSLYPGPGERAVSEAMFGEFTRLALTLAEQDLRERISKVQAKLGGQPPVASEPQMVSMPSSPRLSAASSPGDRGVRAQQAGPSSPSPMGSAFVPPTSVTAPVQAWQQNSTALPQTAMHPPVQFTPSAQRLQDLQRIHAEEEQRLLNQARLQQQFPSRQPLPQPQMQLEAQPHSRMQSQPLMQNAQLQSHQPTHQQDQPFLEQQQRQPSWTKQSQDGIPGVMADQMSVSRQSSKVEVEQILLQQRMLQQQQQLLQQQLQQQQLQQQQLQQQQMQQQMQQQQQMRQQMEQQFRDPDMDQPLAATGPRGFSPRQTSRPTDKTLAVPTTVGASSSGNSFRKVAEEDQVSCGIGDTLDGSTSGIDPAKSLGHMKPPALGGTAAIPQAQQTSAPPSRLQSSPFTSDRVEEMKNRVLCGHLRVAVFNEHLQLEPKRLALNMKTRRLSILRDDGLCEDSWEVDSLRCVTDGIASTILAEAPPPGLAMAFRFKFRDGPGSEGDDNAAQDRFLCVVLDAADVTQLALEAFSQLCGVPITRAS